jgi:predicted TPR repeat methyltransferase
VGVGVNHYDEIAGEYDGRFTRPVDRWEDENLARLLRPITGGLRVLDLGCGTGWLLDHCLPAEYTGVDSSGPMLAELERKHPGALTVKAEIGEEPWAAGLTVGGYDAIVSTWSLEYLGNLDTLLSVCWRLAAPHGTLALHGTLPRGHRRGHFSVKSAPYRPLGPHQVRQASAVAGIPRPKVTGTGWLPDTWTRLGRAVWRGTLPYPAGTHYAALWTWRLP